MAGYLWSIAIEQLCPSFGTICENTLLEGHAIIIFMSYLKNHHIKTQNRVEFFQIFSLLAKTRCTCLLLCLFVFLWYLLYLFLWVTHFNSMKTRVWKYQRVNQYPSIKDEQTTQWPKEKGQTINIDIQNIKHKTKDRVTRIPLSTGVFYIISYLIT